MSARVGNMAFPSPQDGEPAFDKPYSEATAQLIDEEARGLVQQVRETSAHAADILISRASLY